MEHTLTDTPRQPTLDQPFVVQSGVTFRPVGPDTYEAEHLGAVLRVARMYDGRWMATAEQPGKMPHAWRETPEEAMRWAAGQAEIMARGWRVGLVQ